VEMAASLILGREEPGQRPFDVSLMRFYKLLFLAENSGVTGVIQRTSGGGWASGASFFFPHFEILNFSLCLCVWAAVSVLLASSKEERSVSVFSFR